MSHNRTTQGSWTAIRHKGPRRLPMVGAHRARRLEGLHRRLPPGRDRARGPVRPPPPTARRGHRALGRAALGHPRPQTAPAVVAGPGHRHRGRRAPHLALRRLRRRHGHRGRLLPGPPPRGPGPERPRVGLAGAPRLRGASSAAHRISSHRPPTSSARCSTTRPGSWFRSATPSSTTRRSCKRSSGKALRARSSSSSTGSTRPRRGPYRTRMTIAADHLARRAQRSCHRTQPPPAQRDHSHERHSHDGPGRTSPGPDHVRPFTRVIKAPDVQLTSREVAGARVASSVIVA